MALTHSIARGVALLVGAAVAQALFGSCSAERYARDADRSANRVLELRVDDTLGRRRETVEYPEDLPVEPQDAEVDENPPGGAEAEAELAPAPRVLNLAQSLDIGIGSNRDFIGQKELLFLDALSLAETRHAFTPLVSATLSYLFADGSGIPETHSSTVSSGVWNWLLRVLIARY